MRRGSKPEVIVNEENEFMGFCLSSDFCAEHEWGIGDLRDSFGMSKKGTGISKRMISTVPSSLKKFEKKHKDGKHYYLTVNAGGFFSEGHEDFVHPEIQQIYRGNLACAWDTNSFGIHVDSSYKSQLDALYEAFNKKDICIFLGGGGVFQNPGLVICIASKIPEKVKKDWEDQDQEAIAIKRDSLATGIEDFLKEAGKRWHALSPRRSSSISGLNTEYPVVYWLNPMDQNKHNFGWFTVEDLKLWAANKGPVMKKSD